MSTTLVSLSKRVRQGWGYFGIGRRLLLFSPDGQLYPYMDNDAGLLTPATTDVSNLVPHSPPQALTASSADPEAESYASRLTCPSTPQLYKWAALLFLPLLSLLLKASYLGYRGSRS